MKVLIKINTFRMDKFFHIGTMQTHVESIIMKACQFLEITKFFSSQTELPMAYFLLAHEILVPQRQQSTTNTFCLSESLPLSEPSRAQKPASG